MPGKSAFKAGLWPSNRQPAVHPQLFSGERERRRAREQNAVGRMERRLKGKEEEEIKKREAGERGRERGKKQMKQDEQGRKGKGGEERKERVQTLKPWDTFVNRWQNLLWNSAWVLYAVLFNSCSHFITWVTMANMVLKYSQKSWSGPVMSCPGG